MVPGRVAIAIMGKLTALFPISQKIGIADQIDTLCWLLLQRLTAMRTLLANTESDCNQTRIQEIDYSRIVPFALSEDVPSQALKSSRTLVNPFRSMP